MKFSELPKDKNYAAMKLISTHIYTKLVFALYFSIVFSQKAISQNIPDANFAAAIRTACPTCIDGSNNLLPHAASLINLDVSGKNISNLTGIGGFTGLQTLNCSENQLTGLPNLPSGISYLNCNQNQLTGLPALPTGLTVLSCDNNLITGLPALPSSLSLLFCQNNQLISLPVLPNNLTDLYCINNQLTTLPTLPNSLTKIECRGNQLTSLPALPANLTELICQSNQLTSLPTLPGTLTKLRIDTDKITCLPNSTVGLQVYNANNTLITTPPICNSCTSPVATGATICAGNSVTLTATGCTGSGKVLKWYNATTNVLVPMPVSPTTNTNYYAKCETTTNGSTCVSANSNTVTVNIATSTAPIAAGTTICLGSSANLTATGCIGTGAVLKWYNATTNALVTMPIAPTITTNYYAKCEVTTNGTTCASSNSNTVAVTVANSTTPIASGATICLGGSASLTATGCSGTGTVLKWYNATTNALVTIPVSPTIATNYYAKCEKTTNGLTCISASSNTVTVNIAGSTAPIASGATVCLGSSVSLTATGCSGTGTVLKWYNATTNTLVTMPVAPTATTNYYAKCEVTTNGITCISPNSNSVAVNVVSTAIPVATGASICSGNSVTLNATGCSGTGAMLKWYNATTNTVVNMPVTPTATTNYYAKCEVTINGTTCISSNSNSVTVNIATTAAPVITGASICSGNSVTLTATGCTGTGAVLKWYNAASNSLVTMPVAPSINTNYYAKCEITANGSTCISPASNIVAVTVANATAPVASGATIALGSSVTLTATGCTETGYSLKWFKSSDNVPVSMPVSPTSNTDYYAKCEIIVNGLACLSPASNTITVVISNILTNPMLVKRFDGAVEYIINYREKIAINCNSNNINHSRDFWLSNGTIEGTKKIIENIKNFRNVKDNLVFYGHSYNSLLGFNEVTQDTFALMKNFNPGYKLPKKSLNLFFYEYGLNAIYTVYRTDGTINGTSIYNNIKLEALFYGDKSAFMRVKDDTGSNPDIGIYHTKRINEDGSKIIYSDVFDRSKSEETYLSVEKSAVVGDDLYSYGLKKIAPDINTPAIYQLGIFKNGNFIEDISKYEDSQAYAYEGDYEVIGDMIFQQTSTRVVSNILWVIKGDKLTKLKTFERISSEEMHSFLPILYNNEAYFFARDKNHGRGLWKTDGTAIGTVFVANLDRSHSLDAIIVNNILYFSTISELYRSDGTQAGTYQVLDMEADIKYLANIGKTLYFSSGNELWKYDTDTTKTRFNTVHYHQLSTNPLFNQRKLLKEGDIFKVCADGSEASVFKFSGGGYDYTQMKVELLGNPDNSSSDAHLYGKITVLSANADSLVVRYKHPSHISTTSGDYSIGGFYLKNAATSEVIKEYNLQIHRPPVLLIHGIWSDASSFNKMANQLNGSSLYAASYFIKNVNYNSTNYLPFAVNQFVVSSNIDEVLNTLRNNGFAVGKVDIVGHSMGGILSRLYLQEATYRQDIHKLITLNTPHAGSQLANFYQSLTISDNSGVLCGFWEDPKLCDGGALDNLRVNSDAILQTLNGTAKNRNKVPSHTVTTNVPSNISQINLVPDVSDIIECSREILALGAIAGVYGAVFGAGQCIREYAIEKASEAIVRLAADASLNTIFALEDNDQVVALSSQRGGLTGLSTTLIENQSHSGAASNDQVISKVKDLLIKDPNTLFN